MKQLIFMCLFGVVAIAHAQLEKKWNKGGPCVFDSGNCGLGKRIQTCANCFTPTTREVKCYLLCLKESVSIENKQNLERDADESEFNSWSRWSECTSSCGLGEQMQTRLCKAGAGNCTGDSTKTQSCTPVGECVFQSCDDVPTGTNDENFEQCNINSRRCGNWRMMHAEWKIGSGQTKTKGTGPNYDNTFKKDCGKYVYFDLRSSSSTFKELRMISPVTTTATSCLSFSLSMFSTRPSAMGLLIVKVLGSEDTLFNREGGLGARKQAWEPVKINVPKGSNFLIVFAVTTKGWESDIAIDDIVFTENEKCKEGVDGNWAEWEQWSDCDQSCGTGQKTRMRTCTSPPPTNDGLPCIGHSEEKEICIGKPCPVNGKWGRWGSYSACKQTCGDEYQIRTRGCEDSFGDGLKCLVKDTENEYALSEYQSRKCKLPECIVNIKSPSAESQGASSCPDGWHEFRVDRGTDSELNCYKFSDTMVTYNQAKTACNNANPTKAYLTSILTPEEQEFLLAQSQGDFFNGAKSTSRSGGNRWTDGKAFLYSNVQSGQDLDCAYTDKITGKWNTHACDSGALKHYVCKMPADLWNPWSAFSKCSGSCAGAEGVKVRSRTCAFPREGYPFECIPLDRQNTVTNDGITSEFETLSCTNTAAPKCVTATTTPASIKTTTPTIPPTYSWLEWSATITLDSELVKLRACDGAKANITCEEAEDVNILESDDKFVQMKIVDADCGQYWEKLVSTTGETTCWHYSSDETMDYEAAKAYCSDMGGQIASIVSSEEQNFVMKILPKYDHVNCNGFDCSFWIGAYNDSSALLHWAWEDGTPMGYANFENNNDYPFQDSGDMEAEALVIEQRLLYRWYNKGITDDSHQALCKKLIFQKRECPENWYRIGDECFLAKQDSLTFDKATSICEQNGGTLASITNMDEQNFLNNWIAHYNSGTYKVLIGGIFVASGVPESHTNKVTIRWIDGTYWAPFTYFGGVPGNDLDENTGDLGDCLVSEGIWDGWFKTDCTQEYPYVCKQSLLPEPKCHSGGYRLITPNAIQCYDILEMPSSSYTGVTVVREASGYCRTYGAELAKLDDDYERAFALHIAEQSGITGKLFGFGLSDIEGNFLWMDLAPADTAEIADGDPYVIANYPEHQVCGYVKEDLSGFTFYDCNGLEVIICQRDYPK